MFGSQGTKFVTIFIQAPNSTEVDFIFHLFGFENSCTSCDWGRSNRFLRLEWNNNNYSGS